MVAVVRYARYQCDLSNDTDEYWPWRTLPKYMVANSGTWEERRCQDPCGVSPRRCFRRENERNDNAMEQGEKAIQKSCSANGSERAFLLFVLAISIEGLI